MISTKSRIMLWGRAGSLCSLAECRSPVVPAGIEAAGGAPSTLLGEERHILTLDDTKSRGASSLLPEEFDLYPNLILLCAPHRHLVDDTPGRFTVDVLNAAKASHEQFIADDLDPNAKRAQTNRETIAGYVDHWVDACDLDHWSDWTASLFTSESLIAKDRLDALDGLPRWMLARIWPEGHPGIKAAMTNFRKVVAGFSKTYHQYAEPLPKDAEVPGFRIQKFYEINEWNEALTNQLLCKYESHSVLIDDYALELTRAANLVIAVVRRELLPAFRAQQPVLSVTSGQNLRDAIYSPEYGTADGPALYVGEEDFNLTRLGREVCFGTHDEAHILDADYKQRRGLTA
jgi:hypothetical protein